MAENGADWAWVSVAWCMNHLPVIGNPVGHAEHRFQAPPMHQERNADTTWPEVRADGGLIARSPVCKRLRGGFSRGPSCLINLENFTDFRIQSLRQRHDERNLKRTANPQPAPRADYTPDARPRPDR